MAAAAVPERMWRVLRSSSTENDESSTKFDSHSSSAKSSYCCKNQEKSLFNIIEVVLIIRKLKSV